MGQARLKVLAGTLADQVFELEEGRVVSLGRHPHNTIVLADGHASRWHAMLIGENGRWILSNFGKPPNGTYVDCSLIGGPVELRDGQQIAVGDTVLEFRGTGAPSSAEPPVGSNTLLLPDEISELCEFTTRSVEIDDVPELVRHALKTVFGVTRAHLAGFISLDPEAPMARVTWPEHEQVNLQLSQQLNQRAQEIEGTVWVAGGGLGLHPSKSLSSFSDAICVLLRAAGRPAIGALHVYRQHNIFHERHRRFCEVLGSFLAYSLQGLRDRRTLEAENERLRQHTPTGDTLIGDSPPMRQLRDVIGRAAPRRATVLIQGETGVGKELVALALHRQSPRREAPLVVVNCAAIAATLPEAELFGHTKGAFTGADRARPGLFQQADEGTLFFDEVGELTPECQAKLLRVIEGHGFRPVGASSEVKVDVRILAATNRDLEAEVKRGAFRQDLLYRLQVVTIRVPPLRDHSADIPELAAHFLERLGREHQRMFRLTEAAMARLMAYPWPGNVRQLRAVLESAATLSNGSVLDVEDVLPRSAPHADDRPLNLDELEDWAIRQALRQTDGNISRAAEILGVVRDTLAAKIRRRGIDRSQA